jgi:hypothetical protein
VDYPKSTVTYKYFSFASDRQKGLSNAFTRVFPENHAYFCSQSVHIARNVERLAGTKVSKFVHSLPTTFSHRLSAEMLSQIQPISARGKTYLEEINDKHWRSTAWLDDPTLPPRYGIVTSNMSESMNNMFEAARIGSWLCTIDTMLHIVMRRIYMIRNQIEGKQGIVEHVHSLLKRRCEYCAGFKVMKIHETGIMFAVVRMNISAFEKETTCTIDVDNLCECGQWQEHGFPCFDAMTFFRCSSTLHIRQMRRNYLNITSLLYAWRLKNQNEEEEPEYPVNISEEIDETGDDNESFLENSINADGGDDHNTNTEYPAESEYSLESSVNNDDGDDDDTEIEHPANDNRSVDKDSMEDRAVSDGSVINKDGKFEMNGPTFIKMNTDNASFHPRLQRELYRLCDSNRQVEVLQTNDGNVMSGRSSNGTTMTQAQNQECEITHREKQECKPLVINPKTWFEEYGPSLGLTFTQ